MSFELPHKKVLILGAVCASVILISVSYKISTNTSSIKESSLVAVSGATESNHLADKRVLEALEQINKENLSASTSTDPFSPNSKDTISDRFAKDVFAAYLKYEQKQGKISADELSRDALSNIKTDSLPKPRYNLANIKIFAPKNPDEIKMYGNQFAKEYLETVAKTQVNPEKYSKKAGDMRPIYEEIIRNMLKMHVPSQIASEHIELMNSFGIISDSLLLIDAQSTDPLQSLLGLRMIQDSVPKQYNMFAKISDFFNKNGIIFNDTEFGYIWNQKNDSKVASSTPERLLK